MGVVIFLSEVLSKILIHQQKDYQLYDFIEDAIKYYDIDVFSSAFHIVFLINLSKFLGFYPDMNNNNYQYFDLQHGFYTNTKDSDYIICDDDLKCFNKILGINFDDLNILTFTLVQRKKLLDNIILYYRLHIENFVSVKSLEVLRKLF
jgi:DNA repair protein RecO (recombination protein O)